MAHVSRITQSIQGHELHMEVEALVKSQFRSDIRLGEKLYALKKQNLYKKAIGEGISTWEDYIRQPEVNLTAYRAAKLIRLYEHFILRIGYKPGDLDGVPTYALDYIASRNLQDVVLIDTLLDDAKVLSVKDFKERYHDEVQQTERTYKYMIMRKCVETGNLDKVHDISSEAIQEAFKL